MLEIADERAVLEREGEHRLKWKLEWACEIFAQMIVDFMPPITEDFSGIKNVFRIECIFDCAHHLEQLVAELFAHVLCAGDADTMLSRKRTFELSHQGGGLIGHLSKFFQVRRAVEVEHRSHVKQSTSSVTVITRLQPERFHDRLQAAHVSWQLCRANGSVFDKRHWLGRTDATRQKREARFAHRPDQVHLRRIREDFRA